MVPTFVSIGSSGGEVDLSQILEKALEALPDEYREVILVAHLCLCDLALKHVDQAALAINEVDRGKRHDRSHQAVGRTTRICFKRINRASLVLSFW